MTSSSLTAVWQALRNWAAANLPLLVLGVGGVVAAYLWLQPAPPKQLVLATGVAQGAYDVFGQRYAEALARHGITVTLRPTQGAADNLALLRDAGSGVDVAFVQGGSSGRRTPLPDDAADAPQDRLRSLGSLFYEPVWLFYRETSARRRAGTPHIERLSQLSGWRVNIGLAGSGVPPLMTLLLRANGIEPGALTLSQQALSPAVALLLDGGLDAVVTASAPESPIVQMLLQTPGIKVFDFAQADAYSRRFPFMSPVVLPRGVVDLARDLPPTDVRLVAPTAALVARDGLHPALAQLLVQAAQQVHGDAGWFQQRRQFPNADHTEWPLAPEAERFYRSGPPWLQRWLPFWLANLVDRMWLVALSIIAVLLPLSRVLPPLVEFRIRSRVFRWYAQLREVEDARGQRPTAELLHELDALEQRVAGIVVPLSFADELYALKRNIQLVRRRLGEPG